MHEFENVNRDVLVGDPAARDEVAAGRAFSVAFATEPAASAYGVVWRPLEPVPLVPLDIFWRPSAGAVVRNFVGLAWEVSERERWLAPVVDRGD